LANREAPPDPQNARSPAAWKNGRAKSQKSVQSTDNISDAPTELQARKLCRRYALGYYFATVVAQLAFAVPR